MAATFEIKINAIRTGTVGGLTDVIKRADFTVRGTESGQSFELPQTVEVADPDPANFIQFANVSEADVVRWVEETFPNMEGVKAHIQFVLDKEVAKAAFENKPMPWVPAPAPSAPLEGQQ